MRLEELIGKWVIRKARTRTGDASFTTTPIEIKAVKDGICYYRMAPRGSVHIMGPDAHDNEWHAVDSDLLELKTQEKRRNNGEYF